MTPTPWSLDVIERALTDAMSTEHLVDRLVALHVVCGMESGALAVARPALARARRARGQTVAALRERGLSFAEIGELVGVTRQRAHQFTTTEETTDHAR